MEDVEFSDAFCRFLQTHVPTVDAAELLIGAFRSPGVVLPPNKQLEAWRAAGVFDQDNAEMRSHLATLAQAYERRPVTLVRLIYALRDGKIRSFADAFKLKKD